MSEDGYCAGYEVFVEEGRLTAVLGPDGKHVRYLNRHKVGFDLSRKAESKKQPNATPPIDGRTRPRPGY